ncbi:166_t:CDS:1, partial [Dentiscutata erythropus]
KDNSQESKDNSQESKDNSQESKDNFQENKDNFQENKDNSQENQEQVYSATKKFFINFNEIKNNLQQGRQIREWIKNNNINTLFITGPKASNSNHVDVDDMTYKFCLYLFNDV